MNKDYITQVLAGLTIIIIVGLLAANFKPLNKILVPTPTTDTTTIHNKIESNKALEIKEQPDKGDLDLVLVQGGTFMMGCTSDQNDCGNDESPAHQVTVNSFKMSKTEVTVAQFAKFVDATGYTVKGGDWKQWCSGTNASQCNMPVVNVTWTDAVAFCNWAGGRLPTEAEWEYAARGGNKSNKYQYAGGDNLYDVGWFADNSSSAAHAVATKKPNELGLYDMSGNVSEWCSDWYGSDYYTQRAGNNPMGASSGTFRVLRGGSWDCAAELCRSANRRSITPGYSDRYLGFRVVVPQ